MKNGSEWINAGVTKICVYIQVIKIVTEATDIEHRLWGIYRWWEMIGLTLPDSGDELFFSTPKYRKKKLMIQLLGQLK